MFYHFLCISGFRQNLTTIPGTWLLSEKLRAGGFSSGSRLRVTHACWNDDWNAKAEEIANLAKYYGERPRVAVFAYSWGAGYGATTLARELYRRGLSIEKMVLSDPVFRHPLALFRWLALLGIGGDGSRLHFLAPPVIRLPPNVGEVWAFYQRLNRPAGHRIAAQGSTHVHPPEQLLRVHGEMDDAPEFHDRCIAEAGAMISPQLRQQAAS